MQWNEDQCPSKRSGVSGPRWTKGAHSREKEGREKGHEDGYQFESKW